MDFDLRTPDSAYQFALNILGMNGEEFISDYLLECDRDYEVLWKKHYKQLRMIDASRIRINAFHITGSLDGCQSIRKHGLQNLQEILSENSVMKRALQEYGLFFNVAQHTMVFEGREYDIDYTKYRSKFNLYGEDQHLKSIAYRLYYDYCVNGFMCNDDVFSYGTDIHKRPEFIADLVRMFPKLLKFDIEWRQASISYKIDFFAYPDQLHRFNFDLDNYQDPPYENWDILNDNDKLIKWMLSHAINRAYDELTTTYLYVLNDISIPPEQITNYTRI